MTSKEKLPSTFTLIEVNSRTNITEKDRIEDDVENYNHFAYRDQSKGNSTSSSLAHMLKGSLGSGILAMPMAFKNAGLLFGIIGSIVSGIVCTHCVYILVKTSQQLCRETKVTALGFADTTELVFERGPRTLRPWAYFAKQFVDGALMMTYYATTSVYIVFIAQSFHDVVNYDLNLNWDVRIYIALTVLPLLFVGQVRTLKYLVPFSTIANIFIVISFAITLYYIFSEPLVFSNKPLIANYKQIPMFFATAVFAMEGIGSVMPIENSMKKPQHFLGCPGVLTTAMGIVVSLYAIIGFLGYARYGDQVLGSITLNLQLGSYIADAAKILMALSVFFTYGLVYYVPNEVLWKKIEGNISKEKHNFAQILMRFIITIVGGVVAAMVPNLEYFMSLVGAIFLSLLGFFIPSLTETVYLWPNNLGLFKWILIKNMILMILSICLLVAGSWISVQQIVNLYL